MHDIKMKNLRAVVFQEAIDFVKEQAEIVSKMITK